MAEAKAQTDTTRRDTTTRPTSEQRIPIRKEAGSTGMTERTSRGDVSLAPRTRIDSLEALSASYSTRIDSLERANASFVTRLDETDRLIAALRDSLNTVRSELATARSEIATVRTELSATTARTERLADSLVRLNTRFSMFRNRSLFGNSGFYVGVGTGPTYTRSALSDIGYQEGLQVTVPIGWHKTGSMIGVRTEWAWQNYDGRFTSIGSGFSNNDPNVYSGTAMLSLHLPINSAKTHTLYAMGGGGVYHFRDFNNNSALGAAFGGSTDSGSSDGASSETKFGFLAGVGAQFHILGATYLFVQTSFNNVSADNEVAGVGGKNLQWMPLVLGVTLR
jgi:opacity protein-like surface antigen